MKREDIEKAAVEFANEKCQKRGCSKTYRLHFDFDRYDIEQSFETGAEWRINSVWHKPSAYGEELTRGVEVIAKTKRGYRFGKFDVVGCFHAYIAFVSTSSLEYSLSDVLEYAYLDDLIPSKEGEG